MTDDFENRTSQRLDRIARIALRVFVVSFLALIVFIAVMINAVPKANPLPPEWFTVAMLIDMLMTFVAGITYVCALFLRDMSRNRWRFSLAELLLLMTLAAVMLTTFLMLLRQPLKD